MLGKEGVLIVGAVAEQREGLRVNASAGDDFRPPAGNEVERGVFLEHAHGVRRAENGDGAGELQALGLRGDRRKHDRGCRNCEVEPVMLAGGEDIEPRLVGQFRLRKHFGKPLGGGKAIAGDRVLGDVAKGVDAELHELFLSRDGEMETGGKRQAPLSKPV
jgi:hypothetical protein